MKKSRLQYLVVLLLSVVLAIFILDKPPLEDLMQKEQILEAQYEALLLAGNNELYTFNHENTFIQITDTGGQVGEFFLNEDRNQIIFTIEAQNYQELFEEDIQDEIRIFEQSGYQEDLFVTELRLLQLGNDESQTIFSQDLIKSYEILEYQGAPRPPFFSQRSATMQPLGFLGTTDQFFFIQNLEIQSIDLETLEITSHMLISESCNNNYSGRGEFPVLILETTCFSSAITTVINLESTMSLEIEGNTSHFRTFGEGLIPLQVTNNQILYEMIINDPNYPLGKSEYYTQDITTGEVTRVLDLNIFGKRLCLLI